MRFTTIRTFILAPIACVLLSLSAPAQVSFKSGSTGSDGALDFTGTPSGTTVLFNPATYNPPLDPAHDNIFNFTTITIPAGVTVRLSGRILSGPVYWLASGNVTINGTLDLSGEGGAAATNVAANRIIAYPGAGGYAGGIGGMSATLPPTAGLGPAGGAPGPATYPNNAGNGGFTANNFLVPLIGGSGGGGGYDLNASTFGSGGGAGGGAIMIASSTSIACNGAINASGGSIPNGGSGGYYSGGGGAGGGIHLIAATVSGYCGINVRGGYGVTTVGGVGFARIETASYTGDFGFNGNYSIMATPNLYLPTVPPGTIQAISVNGISLPVSPTGSYVTPDATINSTGPVNIVVQASSVPVGTIVTLQITSDQGTDMTIQCPALTGSLASSTTTASVTFPPGFSRGYLTATW